MDRYLITGFSGFVSGHFLDYLEMLQNPVSVMGIDINPPEFRLEGRNHVSVDFQKIDLLDRDGFEKIIALFKPHYILHLASFSSVAFSWKNPVISFQNNTNIFLNLLEAVRSVNPAIRILSVGSSEEYGNLSGCDAVFREEDDLNPVSPYAVARVSQEMLSKVYVKGYGLDIVMTRSFNHMGPGQKETFAIASFAKRLVEMRNRASSPRRLLTGDIAQVRDFVDVRDVVRAYDGLLKRGRKGEIYNVCSGVGHSLKELIQQMLAILDMDILMQTDERLIRPNDNKIIVGSNEKIRRGIGWSPEIPLEQSLKDVIDFWKRH